MNKIVPVYPWPMHQKVADALAAIPGVMPVEARAGGGTGVVLAVNKVPTFVCDAIVVRSPERLAEAVHIITDDGMELVSMREMVAEALGVEVIEKIEPVVSKVRFE